ncbi:MAG: hypothetical protein Q8K22_06710 [Rhodoferax sp.]|nr:hypothetical protein [Rhodoferax sp.]
MSKSHKGSGIVTASGTSGSSFGGGHAGGHGLQGSGDVFSFTTSAGAVTAAKVTLASGTTVALPLTTGVTYSVSGADVLATRTDSNTTESVRYSDTDADGFFQVISSSKVLTTAPQVNLLGFSNRETVSVTLDAAKVVTGVTQAHWNGVDKVLLSATVIPANTTWAITNGLLVETHTETNGQIHWEVFRDGNTDGAYTEVASGTGALIDLVGVVAQTDAFAALL